MTSPLYPPLLKGFSWTPATANEDGSPITPGEVTAIQLGIRVAPNPPLSPDPNKGVYTQFVLITDPKQTEEAKAAFLAALGGVLAPGDYLVGAQEISPTNGNSKWSDEAGFSIPVPVSPPLPVTGFTVA